MTTRSALTRIALLSSMALASTFAAGCSSAEPTGDNLEVGDDDLTSLTALSREVKFSGVVYVGQDSSDEAVQVCVAQTESGDSLLR